jgi:hypothetical protein
MERAAPPQAGTPSRGCSSSVPSAAGKGGSSSAPGGSSQVISVTPRVT